MTVTFCVSVMDKVALTSLTQSCSSTFNREVDIEVDDHKRHEENKLQLSLVAQIHQQSNI